MNHQQEITANNNKIAPLPSLPGGANVRNQIKRLRDQKPQIIVATPGRLAELVFQLRKLRLGMVRAIVIDEVDSMLKEPFIGEILTIIEATAMFKRDSRNSERVNEQKLIEERENGSFGYSAAGAVDDNDDRYDDDGEDVNLDDEEEGTFFSLFLVFLFYIIFVVVEQY